VLLSHRKYFCVGRKIGISASGKHWQRTPGASRCCQQDFRFRCSEKAHCFCRTRQYWRLLCVWI